MYFSPGERSLGDIVKKVEHGERLSKDDGIRLLESHDLLAIGYMANLVREKKHGDYTYFICGVDKVDKSANIDTSSEAFMLYGHGESIEDRIDHLISIREQQDKSGEFLTFFPRASYPKHTDLEEEEIVKTRTTGVEDLKILAVSRLMLDNFPHIKANWVMIGPKLFQVSLSFGVDDIDGAGAETDQPLAVADIINMIKKANRKPLERDKHYNVVREGF